MSVYISMLRGINVGANKRIRMTDLIALYESLGFKNVRTYLQSGNVVFGADGGIKGFSRLIEDKIELIFGFSVAVLIRTPDEFGQIIIGNPFLKDDDIDASLLYVTFLSAVPGPAELNKIKENSNESDAFIILSGEIYLYCPHGYGGTKYSNAFFEKRLGLTATTRNWQTVNALLEMARN